MAKFKVKDRVRISDNSMSRQAGKYGTITKLEYKPYIYDTQKYSVKTEDGVTCKIVETALTSAKVVKPERKCWMVIDIDNADVAASELTMEEAERYAVQWAEEQEVTFVVAKEMKRTKLKHCVLV